MNTKAIVFAFLAFTIFKGLIISSSIPNLIVPSLNTIDVASADDLISIPDCNAVILCLNIFGAFLYNAAFIIFMIVQVIINLIVFLLQTITMFVQIQVATIPGVPQWVNFILFTTPLVFLVMSIFNAFRGRNDK